MKGMLTALALVMALSTGCAVCSTATGEAEEATPQTSQQSQLTTREDSKMTEEERAVLAAYEAMQQAMVDKDAEAMRALTTEDKTFTHMSGKVQSREEFFGEIADGTLNYFGYEIHDPQVTVEGDRATLTGSTTLDARVYGASGSWTLPTDAHFVKRDGGWVQCN